MYKFRRDIACNITVIITFLISFSLKATPWVETDDVFLRSNLQLLADAGVITIPVNTFPLPWREISEQMKQSKPLNVDKNIQLAYAHIIYKMNAAKKGYGKNLLKLKVSEKDLPSSFGQSNDVKWGGFSSTELDDRLFSMKLSANYAQYYDESNPQYNIDNSYFAVTTGNTNFFLDTQSQWWSVSWLESLTAEQRIHPAYELGTERTFLNVPLIGTAYFKTGINQLRHSDDWQYAWRSRLSLRPVDALELSLSHFDFYDAQTDNVEEHDQQSSVDGRISFLSNFDVPVAIYGQQILNNSQSEFTDYLIGTDYSLFATEMQMRFVFEYRHRDDNDLRYSVGSYVQMKNDHQWQLFYYHNSDDDLNNQLVGSYRFLLYKGMLSLSLSLSDGDDTDSINTGASWELRF